MKKSGGLGLTGPRFRHLCIQYSPLARSLRKFNSKLEAFKHVLDVNKGRVGGEGAG